MPEALTGCGIAITRPIEQAHHLAELVSREGGRPILFPLLEITPLAHLDALYPVLDQTPDCDWAIFISSNAVQQGMPLLLERHPLLPPSLHFAAIGPATAAELQRHGIEHALVPEDRFDSESLLALPEMQDVHGKRVVIFRGVGGRELLAEQLRARGADVCFAECYRRINPQQNAGDLPGLWQNKQLHAIVVTSSEALRHLVALGKGTDWLRGTPLCVNHPRIRELAEKYGLQAAVADLPGDEGMLNCLIQNRRQP